MILSRSHEYLEFRFKEREISMFIEKILGYNVLFYWFICLAPIEKRSLFSLHRESICQTSTNNTTIPKPGEWSCLSNLQSH